MYRPVLVTPPAIAPVSLPEAKQQVREEAAGADSDAVLTAYRDAAVGYLDGWSGILGRCLISQTWRQDFDRFARCLRLPLFPVVSITSVKYDDVDGAEQTVPNVDNASYELLTDDLGSYVRFKDTYSYPSLDTDRPALRVAYVAGYGTNAADVPAPIRHAILMLVGHWFANREAIAVGVAPSVVPLGVEALLAPYRRVRF